VGKPALMKGEAKMTCERCGGFKVFDYFYGTMQCDGFRCVNCGAITDMRIIMPPSLRMDEDSRKNRSKSRLTKSMFAHSGVAHTSEAETQP
jgi:hypothetical protein